jgi:hypothetical protein
MVGCCCTRCRAAPTRSGCVPIAKAGSPASCPVPSRVAAPSASMAASPTVAKSVRRVRSGCLPPGMPSRDDCLVATVACIAIRRSHRMEHGWLTWRMMAAAASDSCDCGCMTCSAVLTSYSSGHCRDKPTHGCCIRSLRRGETACSARPSPRRRQRHLRAVSSPAVFAPSAVHSVTPRRRHSVVGLSSRRITPIRSRVSWSCWPIHREPIDCAKRCFSIASTAPESRRWHGQKEPGLRRVHDARKCPQRRAAAQRSAPGTAVEAAPSSAHQPPRAVRMPPQQTTKPQRPTTSPPKPCPQCC